MNAVLILTTLLAVFCLSGAMTPEYKEKMISSMNDCMKQLNLEKEETIELIKSKKILQDQEKKCIVGCTMDKMGYVKDLKVDWDLLKAANPEKFDTPESVEKGNQVVDTCAKIVTEKEANICELGVKAVKCLHEEAKKVQLPIPDVHHE